LNHFLTKNDNADAVVIMSLVDDNKTTKRQLGLFVKKFENFFQLNNYIQDPDHKLDLEEKGIPINQARLKLYEQKNAEASRKQVLPVIEQFVKTFTSEQQ